MCDSTDVISGDMVPYIRWRLNFWRLDDANLISNIFTEYVMS